MPFTRPTLPTLIDRVQTDIDTALTGVNARVRRTVEHAFARAVAGVAHGLHGHLAWVGEQAVPDRAGTVFLLRWASFFGVTRKAAVAAQFPIKVTGNGGDLPAGTEWTRLADDAVFTVDSDRDDVDPSATIQVTAQTPGAASNMTPGETLALVSPLAGIDSTALVSTGGTEVTGTDVESEAELLSRLLLRIQGPPMGGAPGDHTQWALEVAGVTRAWEFPRVDAAGNSGVGKVAVTFVRDNQPDIIPTADEVAVVQGHLDTLSPATVIVFAPTAVDFDYSIQLEPNTAAVQAAVDAEIADLLASVEPGGTILWSLINEAISVAAGETDHVLTTPAGNVDLAFGEMAVPGTPTYGELG